MTKNHGEKARHMFEELWKGTKRTPREEIYFHLSQLFFSLRNSSTEEELPRSRNNSKRKKRSKIKFKDPNQQPSAVGNIDVGMSVARGSSK